MQVPSFLPSLEGKRYAGEKQLADWAWSPWLDLAVSVLITEVRLHCQELGEEQEVLCETRVLCKHFWWWDGKLGFPLTGSTWKHSP